MATYAKETTVSVEQSKKDIEQILSRYGASKFFSGWDEDHAMIGFSMRDRFVQFRLPLPKREEFIVSQAGRSRSRDQIDRAWRQAQRSSWRSLLLCIKAKLESVDAMIESFEEAFLAHILVTDGKGGTQTVGDAMIPQIEESYNGDKPRLELTRG